MKDKKYQPGNWPVRGAITALVTPFKMNGEIDWEAYFKLLNFQARCGISGVVPVGTTGQSPTVDREEHLLVIDQTIEKLRDSQVKVYAGTGSNCTKEAIEYSTHAVMSGANGVLPVDSYYSRPPSCQLRDEYLIPVIKAARRFNRNIIVIPYVIPSRTGTKLLPEDLANLKEMFPDNVVAIKDATGDPEYGRACRCLCGPDFSILSGDDSNAIDSMADPKIMASGLISVVSNIFPRVVGSMIFACLQGNFELAGSLEAKLMPVFKAVTVIVPNPEGGEDIRYPNPEPIITMMAGLGMIKPKIRQPLGLMNEDAVNCTREALRQVWQDNPDLFLPLVKYYRVDVAKRLDDDKIWSRLAAK